MQSRKVNKQITSSSLNQEEIEELREAFLIFDKNNTGKINISELKKAMETLGLGERNPILYQMVLEIEKNHTGKKDGVTFETFMDALNQNLGDFSTKDGLRKLFELFNDNPKAEIINAAGLIKIRDSLAETGVDNSSIEDIIKRVSKNGDDEISFEEFYQYMTRKVYA